MKVTIQKIGRTPLTADDFGSATEVSVRTVLEKTGIEADGFTILVGSVRGDLNSIVTDGTLITLSPKVEGGVN